MILLGIDPGASGGIAAYNTDAESPVVAYETPETETEIFELIAMWRPPSIRAVIEKVHAFPGQGSVSMFSFGQNYGFLRGCLIALGIRFEEVSPKDWQKAIGLRFPKGTPYNERKKLARAKAQQLYPGLKVEKETADALLILEFLRRRELK